MNPHHSVIRRVVLSLLLCAAAALAHGGLEHIRGTVSKVAAASLTVSSPDGKAVEVFVNASTIYSRGGQAVHFADIRAGDRVVIHAEKSGGKWTAHTVEAGPAAASAKAGR